MVKIDMVYTYVDGHDPAHIEKRKYWQKLYGIDNECTDSYSENSKSESWGLGDETPNKWDHRFHHINELYYSIRTVQKNIPWINNIYIVTDSQIPDIRLKNLDADFAKKIKIIDHTQIIPREYLPTFNSDVIESYLHNIPGLSDIFLYNNDDIFHFGTVKISDVVDNGDMYADKYIRFNGRNVVKTTDVPADVKLHITSNFCLDVIRKKTSEYAKRILYTTKIIDEYATNYLHINNFKIDSLINNHHTKILRKKTMKTIENTFSQELQKLRQCKFRTIDTIQYLFLEMNIDNLLYNNKICYDTDHVAEYHFGDYNLENDEHVQKVTTRFDKTKKHIFACFNSMHNGFKAIFSDFIKHFI